MKRKIGMLALLFIVLFHIVLPSGASSAEYSLGAGDVLEMSVWGLDELTVKEVVIRPDGKLSLPLIGETEAAGLTVGAFTHKVTVALSEYVKQPKVTVNVRQFRTTRVYVLGEVLKPGMVELTKSSTLLDAIGAVGGYTPKAAKRQVMVLRQGKYQEPPLKINLLALLRKGDMSQNIALREGDIVFLSNNGKINFARDIMPYISAAYYLDRIDN